MPRSSGTHSADVGPVGVELLALRHRVEHPEVGRGVAAGAGHPLPVELVLRHVAVHQPLHEVRGAALPAHVQVLDQERRDDHAHPVVHPAERAQLAHAGVDERVAGPPGRPGRERGVAVVPRVVGHDGPQRPVRRAGVVPEHVGVELAPRELGAERRDVERRGGEVGEQRPRVQLAVLQRDREHRRARRGRAGRAGSRTAPGRRAGTTPSARAPRASPAGGSRTSVAGASGSAVGPRRRPTAPRGRGAGAAQPWSSHAPRNGVNTWNGVPPCVVRRPGATAYGEPVRTSGTRERPLDGVVATAAVRLGRRGHVHGGRADLPDHAGNTSPETRAARPAARRWPRPAPAGCARGTPGAARRTSATGRGRRRTTARPRRRRPGPASPPRRSAGLSASLRSRRNQWIVGTRRR